MKSILPIIFIVLRLFLGGTMVYMGAQKFKPNPTALELAERVQQFATPEQEGTLQKILYVSGSKQTGYVWQVLGISEILFGLLILAQGTSFLGAIFLLPITLLIFLFHFFLEPDETGKLLNVTALFVINILLVLKERQKWKHLLWIHPLK